MLSNRNYSFLCSGYFGFSFQFQVYPTAQTFLQIRVTKLKIPKQIDGFSYFSGLFWWWAGLMTRMSLLLGKKTILVVLHFFPAILLIFPSSPHLQKSNGEYFLRLLPLGLGHHSHQWHECLFLKRNIQEICAKNS